VPANDNIVTPLSSR